MYIRNHNREIERIESKKISYKKRKENQTWMKQMKSGKQREYSSYLIMENKVIQLI